MKRTGEFVMSIIAIIINVLAFSGGFNFHSAQSNDELKRQWADAAPNLSQAEINQSLDTMSQIGTFVLYASVISVILSIIALVFLKGNKKPVLSGWLLIVAGIVSLVEIIPGILYLIAGIMTLVRKPKDRLT
ncbi:hypothetical protein GCM10011391_18740 [Pullulanibacillus camelliae]|uniref:DUF4064 domain-containing protein n=1 Tax=Pullulanibacillus camelliae TaxID=1707096 RepID=A0A8J2VUG0_9BACL|nr:DUF4064 domain-containing protein [Pullulanibacillus camelliae]GGE40226.1 hypothetical protein GCM10011391_18740 [Pullulanibacillus camelliae]